MHHSARHMSFSITIQHQKCHIISQIISTDDGWTGSASKSAIHCAQIHKKCFKRKSQVQYMYFRQFLQVKISYQQPKKNLHFQFLILKNFCILYHCAIYGSSEIWLWSQRVYNVSRRWFPVFFRVIIFSGRCVVRVSPLWVSCTVTQI